jgi:YjbE family integral membrane protein
MFGAPALLKLIGQVLGIVLLDVVLSGDNALVIGMAVRRLHGRQRRLAVIGGAAGAIGLRVLFAVLAGLLLHVPLLQAGGAGLLLWIAWKLLAQEQGIEPAVREAASLWEAIQTVILADVVMSLDNILAVGGLSHGDAGLLLFGLGLSISLIMLASNAVAWLMNRLPLLVYAGVAVLTWTAGSMLVEDRLVHSVLATAAHVTRVEAVPDVAQWFLPLLVTVALPAWFLLLNQPWQSVRPRPEADEDPPA